MALTTKQDIKKIWKLLILQFLLEITMQKKQHQLE